MEEKQHSFFYLGRNQVSTNCGYVALCLQPKTKAAIVVEASVLTKKTNDLPSRHVNTDSWETDKDLQQGDLDFNRPSQVDLIIGAGHYEDLMVKNNQINETNVFVTYRL